MRTSAGWPAVVASRIAGPATRVGVAAAVVAAVLAAVALLAALTDDVAAAATTPAASYDALLAGVALTGAWLVAARLAVVATAVLVGALPGAVGRAGRRVAERLTPRLLRGALRLLLGTAVVGGPLALAPAAVADGGSGTGVPVLDRVPAVATAGTTAGASSSASSSESSSGSSSGSSAAAGTGPGSGVVVRPGDSLWRIAERSLPAEHTAADVAREWPRWYAANRAVVGPDPSLIHPGQRLAPPSTDRDGPAVGPADGPADGSTEGRSS